MLRRQIWLIASVGALIGLQAPLCALACQATQPASVSQDAPPCHEPDPDSAPAGAPSSHADCGCQFVSQALLSRAGEATFPPLQITARPPVWPDIRPGLRGEPQVARTPDLPAPDILLLKSTLLI
jgi:hypothetical protein